MPVTVPTFSGGADRATQAKTPPVPMPSPLPNPSPLPPFPPSPPVMAGKRGTTYGGRTGLDPRMPVFRVTGNPVENTGSLTGHILNYGRRDLPMPQSSTRKVVIVGFSMLAAMIIVGLVAGLLAGDQVSALIKGILRH